MSKMVNWKHARVKVGGDFVHVRAIVEICRRLGYNRFSDYSDFEKLKGIDFFGFKEIFDNNRDDSSVEQ